MSTFQSSLDSESKAEHYCHKVHRVLPMVKPEKIPKYSKSVLARVPTLTPIAQKFLKISSYVGLHVGNRAYSCGISLGCSATEDRQQHAHNVCETE